MSCSWWATQMRNSVMEGPDLCISLERETTESRRCRWQVWLCYEIAGLKIRNEEIGESNCWSAVWFETKWLMRLGWVFGSAAVVVAKNVRSDLVDTLFFWLEDPLDRCGSADNHRCHCEDTHVRENATEPKKVWGRQWWYSKNFRWSVSLYIDVQSDRAADSECDSSLVSKLTRLNSPITDHWWSITDMNRELSHISIEAWWWDSKYPKQCTLISPHPRWVI
jgi:hypothetical protein